MRGLQPFSTAKGVWSIIRELSLDEIREQAELPPRILVLSNVRGDAERVAANVTGLPYSGYVTFGRLDQPLADIGSFDAAVIFDEPTPQTIIDRLRPDVLVKGADWAADAIVGRETVEAGGGKVVRVPIEQGWSTSAIIEKAKATPDR